MGHRLSKIVTRTGDAGTTGLGDGSRVAKDSARIDAIGAVDELNSSLGLLLAEELPDAVAACLIEVQHDLFDLGGELSIPGHAAVSEAQVLRLEEAVERFNAGLHPLKELPRVMSECGLLVGGVLMILGEALGFTHYLVDA